MKISFVLPGWPKRPVGGFKVIYEYANRLSEKGHKITVIHPVFIFPEETDWKKRIKGVTKLLLHFLGGFRKIRWFSVSAKVQVLLVPNLKEKFIPDAEAIFATAWETAEWVAQYKPNKGEKFYFIQHFEKWGGEEKRVVNTFRLPLKKIVISHWLKDIVESVGEEVLACIPNSVDFSKFHIIVPPEKRSPYTIAMLSAKGSWKGFEDGLEALKILQKDFSQLKVLLYGVSLPELFLPDWITFFKTPSLEKLVEIYNKSAIFVSSSWSEGWGLPAFEALACGCALVTTEGGSVAEFALSQETALVSPIRDPQSLAENIAKLIRDSNLRIQLAYRGSELVKKFSWEKSVEQLEKSLTQNLKS
jgi:glycosyltransferase involved in cell wall biosynthesis